MAAATTQVGFELRGESTRVSVLLRDIWQARGLIRTLAKKDFFVKYRRASIGLLWVVGLPVIQATVLSIIFSRIVRFVTPVKYPVFVFSGILPWTFFSTSVVMATTSIVDGAAIATKVYFPRAVLPIVSVWSGFHGYIPSLGVLLATAAVLHVPFTANLLFLIPATFLTVALTTGFVLVIAALHVYFRDMKYVVQAFIFPWFWASAVMYPVGRLKGLLKFLQFNPLIGNIELYRASFGVAVPHYHRYAFIAGCWVLILFIMAIPLYRRYDRVFCDLL